MGMNKQIKLNKCRLPRRDPSPCGQSFCVRHLSCSELIKHGSVGQAAPVTQRRFPQGRAAVLSIRGLFFIPILATVVGQVSGLLSAGARGMPPVCPDLALVESPGQKAACLNI